MSIKFGNKNVGQIFFGNKAVKAVYFGAKLVWENLKKLLRMGNNEFVGIEYIPNEDITLTSVSIFQDDSTTSGWTWIMHESGLCVARAESNGISPNTELYGLTATLKTISSLGSVTLYKGAKYYIFYKKGQHETQNGTPFAYYEGQIGNIISSCIDSNITVCTSGENIQEGEQSNFYYYTNKNKFPYIGIIGINSQDSTTVKNYLIGLNLKKRDTFNWNGDGCQEPYFDWTKNYAYVCETNLTNLITITDDDFTNAFGQNPTAVQKYAYVMMRAGTSVGRCIRYMPTNSIQYESTDMFGGPDKLYEIQWPMYSNKITSITPVTFAAPSNPSNYDTYYKASGVDWGGITDEAVVIWVNGNWTKATNWTADFQKYEWGNQGIIKRISDNYTIPNFVTNCIPPIQGNKYYLRINGNEV